MIIYNHREERGTHRERATTPKGSRPADGKAKAQPCRIGEYQESQKKFKKDVDRTSSPCYNIIIKGKETIECFTNTPLEGVFATSPRRLSQFSKRSARQSKTSATHGKTCARHSKEPSRLMTQWIGQSTPTSSKIATEFALATE